MTNGNYKGLMAELKEILYNNFLLIAQLRVTELEQIIKDAQSAANNETKSSAGDKHETGRAMAQLETEKLTNQLGEALKLSELLHKINPKEKHQIIGLGSLVKTNNGNFFISASLGKVEHDNETYFAISNASPIGQLLVKKKEKEAYSINNRSYIINKVT
jgi:transcription elongation GreA/GreB family factor